MGIIRMGPPFEFIHELQKHYGVKTFIETGTYYGKTARWAASHFEKVTTIEFARTLYEQTAKANQHVTNIQFLFGDSRSLLKDIIPTLSSPAIFWLDSHWSGAATYGETDECPLLDEIKVINQAEVTHFILIDDARLFLAPPPLPHQPEQWPSISEVIQTLQAANHIYHIVIYEDVIMAVPSYAREIMNAYFQPLVSQAWIRHGEELRKSELRRGLESVGQGIAAILSGIKHQASRILSARKG